MASNPLRDWSSGLLLLGSIVLAFAIILTLAQVLVAQVSERNYPWATFAPVGVGIGVTLLVAGAALRAATTPRRHPKEPG